LVPFQDKPPVPSNPDVNIESAGSETFAVSQFGGFLVDDYTLSIKAKALQVSLHLLPMQCRQRSALC